ncbi:MAG TPA: TIM barrel protein [Anaerovoracaceae bacterium]|nr:TIM barrel protein [Anaerovoracaceae bacterium]
MNHTILGLSSYSYSYAVGYPGFEPEKPLDAFGLVDKTAGLGLHVLQIADNCPLDKLSSAELADLADYAKLQSVELEVGTRGIEAGHLSSYIGIAQSLGAKILRVAIDTAWHHPDFNEIVYLITQVLPQLADSNIILGIENHDRFKAHIFANILEAVGNPYVGIVLDTVNSFACEENTSQVMDSLAKHTVNFHVKDFKIERVENKMGLLVTGTPAGQGFLDIPQMICRLRKEARGDFSSILELWMAPEANLAETLQKEDRWVKESIAYLKRVLECPGSNK